VEEITTKTGNFKKFAVFVRMLVSALQQKSDSVFVDLLTYHDLVGRQSGWLYHPPPPPPAKSKIHLLHVHILLVQEMLKARKMGQPSTSQANVSRGLVPLDFCIACLCLELTT